MLTDQYDVSMIWKGEKVPYIDYHAPIFSALHHLAVPYFGNDATWFAAIDRWIAENLEQEERPGSRAPDAPPPEPAHVQGRTEGCAARR